MPFGSGDSLCCATASLDRKPGAGDTVNQYRKLVVLLFFLYIFSFWYRLFTYA